MKEVTEFNILVNVTFCHVPVHYVRYCSLTFIFKKYYWSVSNLSKECNYPATVYFRFKFEISTGIGVLVGFMINNFDLTIDKLKQKNVKFVKEPKQESFGKHTIIGDPDGHLISIAQIESKSAEGFDLLGLIGAD